MNALYVTVSIPLLLVLVGFNHAHGLTTFGKSGNTQNTQQPATVQGKSCTTQGNCNYIKNTTCLGGWCLCGDNTHPQNGNCKTQFKGPRHICTNNDDCTPNADCVFKKDKVNSTNPFDRVCACQEGLFEGPGGTCGGTSNFIIIPGLMMIVTALSRILN